MGAGQAIFGFRQAQQAKRQEALLRSQGLPKLATPQEYFELYQNASRSNQFEQEKAMTESIMASNLNALVSAGSRAVIGGAPAATLQAQRGIAGAAQRDFQRQQAALEELAAAEARTAGLNFEQESAQYARDLIGAQAGYQAGVETTIAGIDQAIGSAAMAFRAAEDEEDGNTPSLLGFLNGFTNPNQRNPNQRTPAARRVIPEFGFDQRTEMQGLDDQGFGDYGEGFDVNPQAPPTNPPSVPALADPASMFPFGNPPIDLTTVTPGSYSSQQEAAYKNPGATIKRTADGRFIAEYAKGGAVTTPGKYTADHSLEYDVKTKAGKTIATLTGDETLVFNPMQRRFLKKIIRKLIKGETVRPSKADKKEANKTLKAFKK